MKIKVIASGSKGNAYLVSNGRSTLLLECGVQYKKIQEAINYQIYDINACLISHEHHDHAKCYKQLAKMGVDICASKGTLEALDIDGKVIKHHQSLNFGEFKVRAFNVEHDAAEPLGFLIQDIVNGERLLFITDTKYVQTRFKDVDYMMIEANYSALILQKQVIYNQINEKMAKRVMDSHMSIETCIEFINTNKSPKLKEVYLLHLSDGNSDAALFKRMAMQETGVIVHVAE